MNELRNCTFVTDTALNIKTLNETSQIKFGRCYLHPGVNSNLYYLHPTFIKLTSSFCTLWGELQMAVSGLLQEGKGIRRPLAKCTYNGRKEVIVWFMIT